MSSRGSAEIRFELPRATVADRLAALAAIAAGALLPVALVPDPTLSAWLGVAGALTVAVALNRARRTPRGGVRSAELAADGQWRLALADGRQTRAGTGAGTRVLGSTVLLEFRGELGTRRLWLTPADVPADILRRLSVRLLAARRGTHS